VATVSALAGIRVLWLFVGLVHGTGPKAYNVEAAAVLFLVTAATLFLFSDRFNETNANPVPDTQPGWSWLPAFVAAAFLFYWPVLSVGFLADDFVLLDQTRRWDIGFASSILFRPLVLGLWATLQSVSAAPWIFHAVNICLHGIVSFLTMRLVDGVAGRWPAVAAGVVMLTLPTAVEPVTWVAGAFDLASAVFVLGALLVARGYQVRPSPVRRAAVFACCAAAVLCKETGAVAPVLLFVDAAWRKRAPRYVLLDGAALMALAVVYWLWRSAGAGAPAFELTKYSLQITLFHTFGTFAQPWSESARAGAGASIGVAAVLVLAYLFALTARRNSALRVTTLSAWILSVVLPLAGWFFIGPSLEGSRYLYLAAPAWAAMIVSMAGGAVTFRNVVVAALAVIVVSNIWASRDRLHAWSEAGNIRDAILTSASSDDALRRCAVVELTGVPETFNGAYVLGNAVGHAFKEAGLPRVAESVTTRDCAFRWDLATRRFVPSANAQRPSASGHP
jgi:hypothetical protein